MHVTSGLTLSQQVNPLFSFNNFIIYQRSCSRCQQKYGKLMFWPVNQGYFVSSPIQLRNSERPDPTTIFWTLYRPHCLDKFSCPCCNLIFGLLWFWLSNIFGKCPTSPWTKLWAIGWILDSTTPHLKTQAHVAIALGTPRDTITKTPLTVSTNHPSQKFEPQTIALRRPHQCFLKPIKVNPDPQLARDFNKPIDAPMQ